MKFTALLTTAALLGCASASLHSLRDVLVSRQSSIAGLDPSDIPSQCQSQCTPMVNTLNSCTSSTDIACGCTASTKTQVQTCFDCLVKIAPSIQSTAETAEQAYVDGCKSAGVDIGSFSGSSSGSSAGTSASGTAKGSVGSATASAAGSSSTSSSNPFEKNSAFKSTFSFGLAAATIPFMFAAL